MSGDGLNSRIEEMSS